MGDDNQENLDPKAKKEVALSEIVLAVLGLGGIALVVYLAWLR
ncbi:MAG TPA: hypothetical protein VLH84_03865 [Patescibacteria group bacterium]|nr:hypothetical protein [Patescibacteria group bacterium]